MYSHISTCLACCNDGSGSAVPGHAQRHIVIKPCLEIHRAEVKGMLLTEYNEKEQMELFKEDGREEERISSIQKIMRNMNLTAAKAMDILEIPKEEQSKYILMMEQSESAYQPE